MEIFSRDVVVIRDKEDYTHMKSSSLNLQYQVCAAQRFWREEEHTLLVVFKSSFVCRAAYVPSLFLHIHLALLYAPHSATSLHLLYSRVDKWKTHNFCLRRECHWLSTMQRERMCTQSLQWRYTLQYALLLTVKSSTPNSQMTQTPFSSFLCITSCNSLVVILFDICTWMSLKRIFKVWRTSRAWSLILQAFQQKWLNYCSYVLLVHPNKALRTCP